MAAGTTIEKLFISLGLDMTALDSDLLTASKTVNQGMSSLKTKAQQSKLRMEIDMSAFAGAERSTEALAVKTKHLTDQLNIQRQAVSLINATYQESVAAKGADDAASQRILTRLLREQKAEADLARQLKETNAARAGGAAGGSLNTGNTNAASAAAGLLAGSLGRVRDAGASAGNALTMINTKMIALAAVAASGAGLFNVVKGAVEAGDAAYKLAARLNLTAAEAGSLNRVLKISDVDSQIFISTMIKMDKSVMNVGKNGNALTDAMTLFNFSILDSAGKLLPMNDQLAALAQGYKNAAAAGEEEAFVADVLGAKGAALVPVLRDYAINAEAASRIKTIGIDPQQAHDLAVEFKVLNLESAQMSNALGMALMPIAKEILPGVIAGFDTLITAVKDNKEEIVATVGVGVEFLKLVKDLGSAILSVPKFVFDISGIHSTTEALTELKIGLMQLKKHTLLDNVVNDVMNLTPLKGHINNYRQDAIDAIAVQTKFAADEKAIKDTAVADAKKAAEETKRIAADQAGAIVAAKKKEMDAAKANKAALIEMADEVYKSTHSALENELHDVDVKSAKLSEANVSDETVATISAARKKIILDKDAKEQQKVIDDKNKEIKKSTEQMETEIYKISHTSLENRLRDIDIERQEWIKKTNDEVKATQLAEHQKQKLFKDTLNSELSEEIRAVKAAILAGENKADAYKKAHEKVLADKAAEAEAEVYSRNRSGVYLPGDMKRSTVIDGNSAYQITEIMKGFSDITNILKFPQQAKAVGATNTITVSMPINATVNNDTDISTLADKVADRIKVPLLNALGETANGY